VYRKSYKPVMLSRSDVLTVETQKQIENNNDIYFCQYPDTRPTGFDVKVCSPS
jgi:hypothetical protein